MDFRENTPEVVEHKLRIIRWVDRKMVWEGGIFQLDDLVNEAWVWKGMKGAKTAGQVAIAARWAIIAMYQRWFKRGGNYGWTDESQFENMMRRTRMIMLYPEGYIVEMAQNRRLLVEELLNEMEDSDVELAELKMAGLSNKEISEIFGVSAQTIRNKLEKLRENVRWKFPQLMKEMQDG